MEKYNNINFEKEYILNITTINKNLREQIELLYKLMRKKLLIDNINNFNENNKLSDYISQLEIMISNLSIQMKNQEDLINILKDIEIKYKNIKNFDNLKNNIELLNSENLKIKNNYDMAIKENKKTIKILEDNKNIIKELSNNNLQLLQENTTLKAQLQKKIKDHQNVEEILNKMENLSNKLKQVENKYNNQLKEKDLIINNKSKIYLKKIKNIKIILK